MSGVGEDRSDHHDSCKRVVFSLLRQCVPPRKTWTEDDIVRAHRRGKVSLSREANRPRPIIARFKLWQDKMRVVANRSAREILRRNGVQVDDDFTKRQRKRLSSLRNEGKFGFYREDRLVERKLHPDRRSNDDNNSRRGPWNRADHWDRDSTPLLRAVEVTAEATAASVTATATATVEGATVETAAAVVVKAIVAITVERLLQ